MKFRQIGIGTKLELELFNERGDKVEYLLVSQFESYDESTDMMEILAPILEGNIYPVHPKTRINIIFSKENDTFMFHAEVIERCSQDLITFLRVKPLSAIEKIERRSFFRMECELNIQYRILENLLPDEENTGELTSTVTLDISGGGVCLKTEGALEKGTYIEAFLELDRKIRFIGCVARSLKKRIKGIVIFETGIEFKHIGHNDRERIVSFVFETQRDKLKRGWMRI